MTDEDAIEAMVLAGGRQVRVLRRCARARTPAPTTFVIEAARGWHSDMYRWLVDGLSPYGTVVAYDRSGLGRSERGRRDSDGRSRADELHELIESLQIETPCVLVGHSIGALYIRLYAHRYPAHLAGLVFLDATHDAVFELVEERPPLYESLARAVVWCARALGAGRLFFPSVRVSSPPWNTLPEKSRETIRDTSRQVGPIVRGMEESRRLEDTSLQVRECGDLGDLPLLVVSAGTRSAFERRYVGDVGRFMALWRILQRDLLTLSTQSLHHVIAKAGHCDLVTDRALARQVCDSIGDFVRAIPRLSFPES